jgi:hypothetical protein
LGVLDTYDEPPFKEFDLLDIVSGHDLTKFDYLWNMPLIWIYATGDRIIKEKIQWQTINSLPH